MKVDKELVFMTIPTGSRLYGTDTPESDYDFKAIVLPALDDLLLNKKLTNRKEKPEGHGPQDKMTAGGTETEYLPLQVFFDDFLSGQTYALEIAFAVAQGFHTSYDWAPSTGKVESKVMWEDDQVWMQELLDNFLTKNVKKMMGYAVSQARLYGVKTERYSAVKAVVDLIGLYCYHDEQKLKQSLLNCPDLLAKLLALPHVKLIKIMTGDGSNTEIDAIEITGKQYPLTNKLITIHLSMGKVLDAYGERVKEFEGQGVDWKALSHAIRIVEQVVELSTEGTIKFPRPNADFLRRVKSGEVPLDEALDVMAKTFSKAEEVVELSILKDRTPELEAEFNEWKLKKLRAFYRLDRLL